MAAFGVRAIARLVDIALGSVIGFLALTVALVVLSLRGTSGNPEEWAKSMTAGLTPASFAASMLSTFLYHAASEFIGGATLGKVLCGLRVMSDDFARVTLLGALVRSFAVLIDGFAFGAVAYFAMNGSPLRQRFGDRWGNTVVVHRRSVPASGRGFLLTAAGIAIGLAIATAIYAYHLLLRAPAAPLPSI